MTAVAVAKPAARRTDPRSSHEAAEHMKDKVNSQQQHWLTILNEYIELGHADATRSELAEYAATFRWEDYQHDKRAYTALMTGEMQRGKAQIGRRFPELATAGLIRVAEIRKCRVTGSSHQAWTINPIGKAAVTK